MVRKNPARSFKKSVSNKRCEKSCNRKDCPKKVKSKKRTTKKQEPVEYTVPMVQNVEVESFWTKIKNFFS